MFPVRVVSPWHRVPREAEAAPLLGVLKALLDKALSSLGEWNVSLSVAMAQNEMGFKVTPIQTICDATN